MEKENPESQETQRLLRLIGQGDRHALEELLARHRQLLRRFVEIRIDPKLRSRIDPSDVVQEAHLEIARRIGDYLRRQPMPFHLWLRQTTYQNLLRLRRQHVEADCRSVDHEVGLPDASSVWLARQLLGTDPSPEQQIVERELAQRVRDALAGLSETDREVLLMRTFEGLENQEVAQVLGLEPAAASRRYGRAVLRLRQALLAGGSQESDS